MKAITVLLIALCCVHAGMAGSVLKVNERSDFSQLSITKSGLVVGLQACQTCSGHAILAIESLAAKFDDVTFAAQTISAHMTKIYHSCSVVYYRRGQLVGTSTCKAEEVESFVQKFK